MPKTNRYYVVWEGRQKGIFDTWSAAEAQVKGYTGTKYKAFESLEAARAAFAGEPHEHIGKKPKADSPLGAAGTATPKAGSRRILANPPIWDSYSVDAACSGNPGVLEYRCVHTGSREVVFARGPYDAGTNNVGEFLALVEILALCVKKGDPRPIYTDSKTALAWLRNKKAKPQNPQRLNPLLLERLARAEAWLAKHSYPNQVLKWDTGAWGENPADYGRK
ncbi:viroplasmin family protein [Calidithermus timidus]|uniref:ribonuclease H1 domain-containing protein n=1 Tax=Calidithermus timidus TaxID=307124 RepID=UPI00047672C5|nr:ribonuclease H family protein [Calidithermus timidus]